MIYNSVMDVSRSFQRLFLALPIYFRTVPTYLLLIERNSGRLV